MTGDIRCMKVVGQGAWKTKGRRNTQEDSFGELVLGSLNVMF